MFDKTKPMLLGDIFSVTFNLIKETIGRNTIIAAIFFIPAGLLMAYGFESFFSGVIQFVESTNEGGSDGADPMTILTLFTSMGTYFFSIFVFYIGYLGALIGITKISYNAMEEERVSLEEALKKIFSITYLRALGQLVLLSLVLGMIVFAAMALLTIAIFIEGIFVKIIGALILIASILLTIYLTIRWYFAYLAIVGEDTGVFASFTKSSFLVKNYWWRTFGIILLISIVVQFALSIITTPITFFFMWDFISEYFNLLAGGGLDNNDPTIIFEMLESFGFSFGIIMIISSILQTVILPLFNVTLYFDLKIRKNDFDDDISTQTEFIAENPAIE